MNPEKIARLPRDSKRETEILQWLREQDDHQKFAFVWRLIRANTLLGLEFTRRAQLKPVFLETIIEHGFVYADVSSIRWWIEAVIDGLGPRRVLKLLKDHIQDAPLIVHKSLYWFPSIIKNDPEIMTEFRMIAAEFNEKYPGFKSERSTGIHATGSSTKTLNTNENNWNSQITRGHVKIIAMALYKMRLFLAGQLGSPGEGDPRVVIAAHLSYALHNQALAILGDKSFNIDDAIRSVQYVDKMFGERFAEELIRISNPSVESDPREIEERKQDEF